MDIVLSLSARYVPTPAALVGQLWMKINNLRQDGVSCGEKRIARLMGKAQLRSVRGVINTCVRSMRWAPRSSAGDGKPAQA